MKYNMSDKEWYDGIKSAKLKLFGDSGGACSSEVVDEELPSKKALIKTIGGKIYKVDIPHGTDTPLLQLRSMLEVQHGLGLRNFILYSSESDSPLTLSNSQLQQLLSGSGEQSLELDMLCSDEGFESPTAVDVLFALHSKELLGPIVGKDNVYRSIGNSEYYDIGLTEDNYKDYMPAIVRGALFDHTNLFLHTHPYIGKFFNIKRSDLSTNKEELINALESCLSDCKTFQGGVHPSLAIFKIIGWDTMVKVLEEEFGAIITDISTDIHACDANHPIWSTDPCYNSTNVSIGLSSLFGCPSSGMGEPSENPNQSQSQRQGNGT